MTIVATRGDNRKEAVQVVTATAACRTLAAPTGGVAAPATFQMLVKKSGVPLANAFTVVGRWVLCSPLRCCALRAVLCCPLSDAQHALCLKQPGQGCRVSPKSPMCS